MVTEVRKKFFDLDQNIFEILNELKSLHGLKVIFVFPLDSVIFTGVVNLKIIDKYAKEHKIPLILVTEDSYGFKLAQKAGIVAVRKMSQITPDLWIVAERRAIISDKVEDSSNDIAKSLPDVEQETITDDSRNIYENNQDKGLLLQESSSNSHEKTKTINQLKSKVVSGIEFFVGEDVKKNSKSSDIIEDMEKTSAPNSYKNLIGVDMSKVVAKNSSKKGFYLKNFFRFNKGGDEPTEIDSFALQRRRLRFAIFVFVVLLGIFLSVFLILMFLSVEINLSFRSQPIESSFTLLATKDAEGTGLNPDGRIQTQLFTYEAEDVSISRTFKVSRTSRIGEKAKGTITFYNLTESKLNIPAGTMITSIVGQKKFIVLRDVEVPAVEQNAIGEKVPQSVDDVPIEAANIGEEYNISATSGDDKFVIQITGFDDVIKANGRIFSNITGGSSREAYVVLQEDENKAKEVLSQEIKKILEEKLKSLIPKTQMDVEGSISFSDIDFSTLPKVGEETLDQQFSVTAKINGSVFSIAKDALTKASDIYIQASLDAKSEENELLSKEFTPSIIKSTISSDSAVFDIGFTGVVGVGLSPPKIFDLVKGKYIDDAKNALSELENIDRYNIQFKPGFIPAFLRFIPNDEKRVIIRIN